jgi:hypothetical protein
MTNRRELLQIGLAASALPFAGDVLAAAVRPADATPLYKVLYDARFAAGVEFGCRAAANGHPVAEILGDMTRVWYDDLYHRWRQGPVAIAGLTARGALFCLEQLAWAERMRVVFRVEHVAGAAGVAHEIEVPTTLLSATADALAPPDWAARMADVIAQCPRSDAQPQRARARTARTPTSAATEPLFTWVIAPALRA